MTLHFFIVKIQPYCGKVGLAGYYSVLEALYANILFMDAPGGKCSEQQM